MKESDRCPSCQLWELRRIPRKRSMRILPGSRHYICPVCGARHLVWLGVFIPIPGRRPRARSLFTGIHPLPAPYPAIRQMR